MPLTDLAVKNAKPKDKQYRLADGGGLCLLVHPSGSKYWQLRYRYHGKGKLLALGIYPKVKVVAAREKAREAKAILAAGDDPSEARKQTRLAKQISLANTFETVAAEWFELKSPDWSVTHKARTLNILKNNLGRWIGSRPISEITAPELLAALRNTEKKGTLETAKRSLQVAGQVFRYAVATGRAERVPSENLKGTLATAKVKHFSAITEPDELAKLLVAIDGYSGSLEVKAALRLSALLFQRPGEIRHMEWKDLDFAKAEWRYVATKTQSPHIVPLSSQALEILRDLQPVTGRGRYVFPSGRAGGRPLSENAARAALRTMGYSNDEHTPHGFRATARTILDEVLGYRVDWIEHQLAHAVRDANGTAYNRTAHLEGRKKMMQGWADYLDVLKVQSSGVRSSTHESIPLNAPVSRSMPAQELIKTEIPIANSEPSIQTTKQDELQQQVPVRGFMEDYFEEQEQKRTKRLAEIERERIERERRAPPLDPTEPYVPLKVSMDLDELRRAQFKAQKEQERSSNQNNKTGI